jgi:hypothetical protein
MPFCSQSRTSWYLNMLANESVTTAHRRRANAFTCYNAGGLKFCGFAVESDGFLDSQAVEYITLLATAAASTVRMKYSSFLASIHQELSVALRRETWAFQSWHSVVQWGYWACASPDCRG